MAQRCIVRQPVAAAGIPAWPSDCPPTRRGSLVDACRHAVGDAACATLIIEGELAPGSRLNERALCDRLGVSRTPLREAFRLLASEGLIELTPNRGAQVVALSESDIRDSFELMGALEALAGELACARITTDEIAQIKALTFQMLACHARRDLPAYYQPQPR